MIEFFLYNKITDKDEYKIVSIDPGIKNFAVRVEVISNITFRTIKLLHYDLLDMRENKNKKSKQQNIFEVIMNVNKYLKSMIGIFKDCHFILIEKQLGVNSSVNNIFYYIISYFVNCKEYDNSNVVSVNPKLKSKQLKFPKDLKGKKLKDYTTNYIMKLYEEEGDMESLDVIKKFDKKDDLADTKAMIKSLILMINS